MLAQLMKISLITKANVKQFIRFNYTKLAHTSFSTSRTAAEKDDLLKVKFDTGVLELKYKELARLADSSATGNYNDTSVLVTVVVKPKPTSSSFLPLSVDYLHKASAAGKIPSTFTRRDFGASNYEILVGRMIDRSIRPLFTATNYSADIQIVCNLLQFAGKDNPDVLCINTTSYALYNSSLQWNGPIGSVRVGMIDETFITNPTRKQLEKSSINLVISVGPNKNIVMIEGWSDNVRNKTFISAIKHGVDEAYKVVESIKESKRQNLPMATWNTEKALYLNKIKDEKKLLLEENSNKLKEKFKLLSEMQLKEVFMNYNLDKKARDDAIVVIRNDTVNRILKENDDIFDPSFKDYFTHPVLCEHFYKFVRQVIRDLCLKESKRVDGRSLNEIRPITCELNKYNALHGSALFRRGQTQVLCSITFDSPGSMYRSESVENMMSPSLTNFNKNFMLHYEFPPYATNEISRVGGRADRREIGHGALAEKAVYPLFPNQFDLTVRAQNEVLESNGSSSMASVCATSLALMDAGVPIEEHVCGVAMGIITDLDEENNLKDYKILTDISGFEDYYGDMDFKIAGTLNGITAVQADFKIDGLKFNIIDKVIQQSIEAKVKILKIMNNEISSPRKIPKPNMPVLKNKIVSVAQRGKFVGIANQNLKRIYSDTGVTVQSVDETTFSLFAPNANALSEAEEMIDKLLTEKREYDLEFGNVYEAKIVEVVAAGLMVIFYTNMKPTLLPNRQIGDKKILHGQASDFKVGDSIKVKYLGRDPNDGKMRLSRKVLFNVTQPSKSLLDSK